MPPRAWRHFDKAMAASVMPPAIPHAKGAGRSQRRRTSNEYIPVEDEELEQIKLEGTHTIDIDKFVPRNQVDERYLDIPYSIVPNDNVGQEAFAVIRDAIASKKMAALGRVVIARRERVMM